jgi:hypothetical protein
MGSAYSAKWAGASGRGTNSRERKRARLVLPFLMSSERLRRYCPARRHSAASPRPSGQHCRGAHEARAQSVERWAVLAWVQGMEFR